MRADQHFCRNLQISCMKLGMCAYYVPMETTINKEIKMETETIQAKDLQVGMYTEFGKLVEVIDEGKTMWIATRVLQFDIKKNKPVEVRVNL